MRPVNRARPRICQTDRAGLANEKRSTTTPFHRNFPRNASRNITRSRVRNRAKNSTYASRFLLTFQLSTNPSTAARIVAPNTPFILISYIIFYSFS